jgi:hypothetical protein
MTSIVLGLLLVAAKIAMIRMLGRLRPASPGDLANHKAA